MRISWRILFCFNLNECSTGQPVGAGWAAYSEVARESISRVGRGARGRWMAPHAPRPRAKSAPRAPRPRAPPHRRARSSRPGHWHPVARAVPRPGLALPGSVQVTTEQSVLDSLAKVPSVITATLVAGPVTTGPGCDPAWAGCLPLRLKCSMKQVQTTATDNF